jgi:hypothetical protein
MIQRIDISSLGNDERLRLACPADMRSENLENFAQILRRKIHPVIAVAVSVAVIVVMPVAIVLTMRVAVEFGFGFGFGFGVGAAKALLKG